MRGDIRQTNYDDRTYSEMVERQKIGKFNIIKIAKWTNLIIGVLLIVTVVLDFINFGWTKPFTMVLQCFLAFFGLIIICSSLNMRCIRRNFLFLMTGVGRGLFNIFVGSLLFFTDQSNSTFTLAFFMGWFIMIGGLIFLFLSKFKQLSDEDINRAVSVQKKSVNAHVQ